ncbi:hypothetical protein PVAP13_5NG435600 [Panicum virgatum]|uniref:MRN complex-interacting protein N-terminal domain-containing protein n=1 Tax=Panicum virgatum TaxID=38727 RepID=A0A8T0RZ59_PANVG|nr:hypothetical protein PVAP13_5NG435600 [Panicum virgatum]
MKPHKFSNPPPPNSNLPPSPVRLPHLLPTPEPAIPMATKLFLALQCVQCDTMQVKQEKKSSNKWVCVVCNQRQSVLRVHARGYRAADLRRFVQDANLARGRREFAPLAEPDAGWDPAAVEEQGDEFPTEKKRTDWSEYLDDPGEHRDGCGADASDGGTLEMFDIMPQFRFQAPVCPVENECWSILDIDLVQPKWLFGPFQCYRDCDVIVPKALKTSATKCLLLFGKNNMIVQ